MYWQLRPALLLRRERSDAVWLGASCTPVGLAVELNCKLEEIVVGSASKTLVRSPAAIPRALHSDRADGRRCIFRVNTECSFRVGTVDLLRTSEGAKNRVD
jgi:hypothetical protein